MTESDDEVSESKIRKALEDFIIEFDELADLEDQLSQFNLFEAIGVTKQEVRHSDFMGWLLNPRQNHGIGDLFLRRFLQFAAHRSKPSLPMRSPVDFGIWDLSDTTIKREATDDNDRRRIDILVQSKINSFVCVIENKISAGEGDGQLKHYRQRFKDVELLLPIFLTIDGDEPSEDNYLSVSYRDVADLLDNIVLRRGNAVSEEVRIAITHYVKMLRRHFVSDSELIKLAQTIYKKHQAALDYILDNKPDLRQELAGLIVERIRSNAALMLAERRPQKGAIFFVFKEWDSIPGLKKGEGSRISPYILAFELLNGTKRLRLALRLSRGPGDVRNRVHAALAKSNVLILRDAGGSTTRLWSETLLQYDDDDTDPEQVLEKVWPRLNDVLSKFSNLTSHLKDSLT